MSGSRKVSRYLGTYDEVPSKTKLERSLSNLLFYQSYKNVSIMPALCPVPTSTAYTRSRLKPPKPIAIISTPPCKETFLFAFSYISLTD